VKILHREPSNTLERTELWTVVPDGYDQKYLISITRPVSPSDRPHGIILTDGNSVVGTAAQLTYYLELGQLIPPAVTVTVGYPLDNPTPAIVARNRDLTPTAWPEWDTSYGKVLHLPCPPSGDCDRFRRFIIDELKPAVEAEFGVDPDEWTLGGHSLGGLFAVHSLLTAPSAFKRYFAVGSSFWWHKPLMSDLAEQFAKTAERRDVSVYIAAGELEGPDHTKKDWARFMDQPEWRDYIRVMGGYPELIRDSHEMAAVLAECPGYRTKAETLPNETHGSAVFAALSQGLRWLNEP